MNMRTAATHKQSFVLGTRRDIIEFTSLNDFTIDLQLLLCTSQDELFDGVGRDKTQDPDFLLLTDSMGTGRLDAFHMPLKEGMCNVPILCLQIGVWIPIGIVARLR